MRSGTVYILTNRRNGTLYTGVTSHLATRLAQHKAKATDSFTKRFDCTTLVWMEHHDDLDAARTREVQIKRWKRAWKLKLIEMDNPDWEDLTEHLV